MTHEATKLASKTAVTTGAQYRDSMSPRGWQKTHRYPTFDVPHAINLGSMKKRDLIQAVATHTDVDKKTATLLVEGTIDVILATVAKGEVVNISGFAKFAKINRPARMARNPATGEAVKVKAKTVAKISALKGFKDIALGVAPAPKLVTVRKPAAPAAKPAAKKPAAKKPVAKKKKR
jgi:DNA-binding protein HU-beta